MSGNLRGNAILQERCSVGRKEGRGEVKWVGRGEVKLVGRGEVKLVGRGEVKWEGRGEVKWVGTDEVKWVGRSEGRRTTGARELVRENGKGLRVCTAEEVYKCGGVCRRG